jgi:hypothetical protein
VEVPVAFLASHVSLSQAAQGSISYRIYPMHPSFQGGHQKPSFFAKHDPLEENGNGQCTQFGPSVHVTEDFCHSGYKHNIL